MRHWLKNRYDWVAIRAKARTKTVRTGDFLERHTEIWKTLAEVGFGIVTLIGISMYSIPIALILAGLAGIVAVERH